MEEVYFRWHRSDIPFTSKRAWSGLWGSEFNSDGSRAMCLACDGTGEGVRECPHCRVADWDKLFNDCSRCGGSRFIDGCEDCDGEGWRDCVRGFSCERNPEDLIRYFTSSVRSGVTDGDGKVIVFTGEETGIGFDGEPCVVPETVIETLTWDEFLAKYGKENP